MVHLRGREIPTTRNAKTARRDVALDPVQLYQRYIHNFQMTPKTKEPARNSTGRGPVVKKQLLSKPSIVLRPPGIALDMKRSKLRNRVPSKPSIDVQSSRTKTRPKTASTKRKPIGNLEDYQYEQDKEVTFQADEIECFFDVLKETVEEVVERKLSSMINILVDILSKKIEEVANRSQQIEGALGSLFDDLNNRIKYYGEEHSRHFRYICMKLEYDKIFYQHMNKLAQFEQPKSSVGGQQLSQACSQESQHCSQEFVQPRHMSSARQLSDIFETIPSCSYINPVQNVRGPTPLPTTPAWPHQAGDSVFSAPLAEVCQATHAFNHSQSGSFQRQAACQTSRNGQKRTNELRKSASTNQDDPSYLNNRLSQSKSMDVGFGSSENEKVQLGIKEFLNTLKVFESNLTNRDNIAKGESKLTQDMKQLKRNSAQSLMDTDDSSSECLFSKGMSMLSSDSVQNADDKV